MPRTPSKLRSRVRDRGAVIAVAISVMNVATYAYQIVTARMLGPQDFGAFAALMNLLLVVGVVSLGTQATAARRIAADPGHVVEIERSVLQVSYRLALILGLVLIALSPVINLALRLESLTSAALVGITAIPLTMMGAQAGVLQGERRWGPLALIYIAAGVPRLVIGTALIVWHPSEVMAVLGVTLGAVVPVVVGFVALRRPRTEIPDRTGLGAGPLLGEVMRGSQALLAFFALSNVDVMVARNVLSSHDAGLYAAGLIMTKAVLFLPQFIVVVAFPSMSSEQQRGRTVLLATTTIAALGAMAVIGAWLFPGIAMIFVGGDKYAEIESLLWLFAYLGTALAVLQLLVYAVLARQGRKSIYATWLAVVALIGLGAQCDTLQGLLTVVACVDTTLLICLLAVTVGRHRVPAPAT